MTIKLNSAAIFLFCILLHGLVSAQTATIKINSSSKYQKITGFGGFVCSGTFAYNHMTPDEIRKIWGKNSDAGYNIMRLYIPETESSWGITLETAKLAKSLGIIVFASPWTMPVEWKTSNNIAAIYTDANGQQQNNYLKEEYYDEYASYLNRYVTYLRNNGVELDAISIQNEPDMKSTYHGCIWTPEQIANFVKNYGDVISCKVIAPEGVGITDNYANAFLDNAVLEKLDIFAGHQYGAVQNAHKQFAAKGKEVWMTEFLINWNSNKTAAESRNFDWEQDAFDFAGKLNDAMLANVNAWIHYASKRFYGLMGDGTYGTSNGELTKRGYMLSHFAKYTVGYTRIGNTWSDDTNVLRGSSYLSSTGDSIVVMVINPSNTAYNLTVDLPFYTNSGKSVTTSATLNMANATLSIAEETFRPKASIAPSSFTTLVFKKSSNRTESQMTGEVVHHNKIDNQVVSNAAFGTQFKMSGKTVTFDHSNSLISPNTTNVNGYLQLDDRYNALVFHVDNITSTMNYTSANTTLYYVNANGTVNSYNYGTVNFNQSGNFDWALDISSAVLTDGCTGIIGISNSNYSSILTMKLGEVYLAIGAEKSMKFSGTYSKDDSNLLDCLDNVSYTSVDFVGADGVTKDYTWFQNAVNKNCIYYVASSIQNINPNVVSGTVCSQLSLNRSSGNFYVPVNFTATKASLTALINGYDMLTIPFEATMPSGLKAYTLQHSATNIACTEIVTGKIPANTPVLVKGTGTFVFEGDGQVSTPHNLKVNHMNGVYISCKAPVGSYYLSVVNGVPSFKRVASGSGPAILPFSAYLTPESAVTAASLPILLDGATAINEMGADAEPEILFFPNPAKDILYFNSGLYGAKCVILDLKGKTVLEITGIGQIDISSIPAGLYIIKIFVSERIFVHKFVKE